MPRLSGLPGTQRDQEAVYVTSPTGAIRALRGKLAATAAGDEGALNVWRDDAGAYRCEFQRYWVTVDHQTYRTLREVREWLTAWLPKMDAP